MNRPPVPVIAPRVNVRNEAFLAAANRGEFLLGQCELCSAINAPENDWCDVCGHARLAPRPASLMATLISWSVLHRKSAASGTELKGVLALVQLAEGPWWWAALDIDDPDRLRQDMQVRVDFLAPEDSTQKVPIIVVPGSGSPEMRTEDGSRE